ncbi:MAG: hypothetical protein R2717_01550 [Schumannella sp.]
MSGSPPSRCDILGRTAGTKRTGDADWTCTSYDARGRVVQVDYAAYGSASARTVTTTYAVGGDPLTTSVTDPAGTITTVIDLLGRTVTSTDVWGTVTTPSYEAKTGRVLSVVTDPAADAVHTQAFTYDPDGRCSPSPTTARSSPTRTTPPTSSCNPWPTPTAPACPP